MRNLSVSLVRLFLLLSLLLSCSAEASRYPWLSLVVSPRERVRGLQIAAEVETASVALMVHKATEHPFSLPLSLIDRDLYLLRRTYGSVVLRLLQKADAADIHLQSVRRDLLALERDPYALQILDSQSFTALQTHLSSLLWFSDTIAENMRVLARNHRTLDADLLNDKLTFLLDEFLGTREEWSRFVSYVNQTALRASASTKTANELGQERVPSGNVISAINSVFKHSRHTLGHVVDVLDTLETFNHSGHASQSLTVKKFEGHLRDWVDHFEWLITNSTVYQEGLEKSLLSSPKRTFHFKYIALRLELMHESLVLVLTSLSMLETPVHPDTSRRALLQLSELAEMRSDVELLLKHFLDHLVLYS